MKEAKILISNRNIDIMQLYAISLRHYGFDVIPTLNDGLCLIDEIEKEKPDVVIMDSWLTSKGAFDVIHTIIGNSNANIPVFIIMSCENSERIISMLLGAGASYYIPLPFDIDLLVKRIINLLEKNAP